jgi:hypothetical protein
MWGIHGIVAMQMSRNGSPEQMCSNSTGVSSHGERRTIGGYETSIGTVSREAIVDKLDGTRAKPIIEAMGTRPPAYKASA